MDRSWRAHWALDVGALIGLALFMRLLHIGHTPFVDELNHVLAAQSLLEDGSLYLTEASPIPYSRAWFFTYIVAGFMAVFGEGLVVARLPAVLFGSLLVAAVYLSARGMAGRMAAWFAALLVCFQPQGIWLSQLSRFYTLLALTFWLGVLGTYWLVRRQDRMGATNWLIAAGVAAAFLLAVHLHPMSLAGIAAVGVWFFVASALSQENWQKSVRRVLPMALALLLLAAITLWKFGGLERAMALFQYADTWAAADRENFRFYHWLLLDQYATFWTLTPILALLALAARPRSASLFAFVFAGAFIIQSLAAWKAERYIYYAMPALFALWGMGLSEAVRWLHTRFASLVERVPSTRIGTPIARRSATVLLVLAMVFAAVGNRAFALSARLIVLGDDRWDQAVRYRGEPDWQAALPKLEELADASEVVIASQDLKALYFLGRIDYILFVSQLSTPRGQLDEFAKSTKLGVPIIASPTSLDRVMTCHPSGLVIVEPGDWRAPWGVPSATADHLMSNAREVSLYDDSRLRVFQWRDSKGSRSAECAG